MLALVESEAALRGASGTSAGPEMSLYLVGCPPSPADVHARAGLECVAVHRVPMHYISRAGRQVPIHAFSGRNAVPEHVSSSSSPGRWSTTIPVLQSRARSVVVHARHATLPSACNLPVPALRPVPAKATGRLLGPNRVADSRGRCTWREGGLGRSRLGRLL